MIHEVVLVETADMPPEVWTAIRREDIFVEDGAVVYKIGVYIQYAEAHPENCDRTSVQNIRILDNWLKSQFLRDGQRILIYHGEWQNE